MTILGRKRLSSCRRELDETSLFCLRTPTLPEFFSLFHVSKSELRGSFEHEGYWLSCFIIGTIDLIWLHDVKKGKKNNISCCKSFFLSWTQLEQFSIKVHDHLRPLTSSPSATMSDQRGTIKAFTLAKKMPTEAYNLPLGRTCSASSTCSGFSKSLRRAEWVLESQRGEISKGDTENGGEHQDDQGDQGEQGVKKLAQDSGLSVGTIHLILHKNLGLSKVSPHWVPRLLTENTRRSIWDNGLREGQIHQDALPCAILPWFGPMLLFSVPQAKQHPCWEEVWHRGWAQVSRTGGAVRPQQKRVPARLGEVVWEIGQVYQIGGNYVEKEN